METLKSMQYILVVTIVKIFFVEGTDRFIVPSSNCDQNCNHFNQGICLSASKPIIKTIKNVTDPMPCCTACLANPQCIAWNINTKNDICYLRAAYVTNPGDNCISSKIRNTSKPPTPPPSPPPTPSIFPPSDQRPRFHFMPQEGFTNDIQGPFYDPRNNLYHMGYAWHPHSVSFGGAPNRWYHIVSSDLARWQVVSVSLDTAMIKPGNYTDDQGKHYCDLKPTTGSVTIVNDTTPVALFSCNGRDTGTTIAMASPANFSDPLLVDWEMYSHNPVMYKPPTAGAFRDPSTAWLSNGLWRIITACGANCSEGKAAAAAMFSSPDFKKWKFNGNVLYDWDQHMMECPDFYPATPMPSMNTTSTVLLSEEKGEKDNISNQRVGLLHTLKYSWKGKDWVIIGTYNENKQKLVNLVAEPQLLDGGIIYASKSFWDPVNKQRVWAGWLHERWLVPGPKKGKVCANVTVCCTHTLPRAMFYDEELKRMVTPPIPQLKLLREEHIVSLKKRIVLDGKLQLIDGVNGMQLELIATFALPHSDTPVTLGVATRVASDLSQRTDCSVTFFSTRNATLNTKVNNTRGIVLTPRKGDIHSIPLPLKASDHNVTLHCFVDHSVIEAYGMGGRSVISTRTYPFDNATLVGIFASGTNVTLLSFDAFAIGSIWIDDITGI